MGNAGKVIPLVEGDIAPIAIDPNQPEVFLQGLVRKLEGDWIVSLFLVNGQQETERLKDEAWIFQPELEVRSSDGAARQKRIWGSPRTRWRSAACRGRWKAGWAMSVWPSSCATPCAF